MLIAKRLVHMDNHTLETLNCSCSKCSRSIILCRPGIQAIFIIKDETNVFSYFTVFLHMVCIYSVITFCLNDMAVYLSER